MIRAGMSAFVTVVVGVQLSDIQPTVVTVTRAQLARNEGVGANPEFCQGLQITFVSA